MRADFKIDFKPILATRPVRAYFQHALPIVYDDNLTLTEQLSKFAHHLNVTCNNMVTLEEDMAEIVQVYEELEDWVNDQTDLMWRKMNKNLEDMHNQIDDYLDEAQKELDEKIEEFYKELQEKFDKLEADLRAEWNEYKDDLNEQWAVWKKEQEEAYQQFKDDMNTLFKDLESEIKDNINQVLDDMKKELGDFKDDLRNELMQKFDDLETELKDTLNKEFSDLTDELKAMLQSWYDEIKQMCADCKSDIEKTIAEFEDYVNNKLTSYEEEMNKFETDITNQMTVFEEEVNNNFEKFTTWLRHEFQDFKDEVNAWIQRIEDIINEIEDGIREWHDAYLEFVKETDNHLSKIDGEIDQINEDLTDIHNQLTLVTEKLGKLEDSLNKAWDEIDELKTHKIEGAGDIEVTNGDWSDGPIAVVSGETLKSDIDDVKVELNNYIEELYRMIMNMGSNSANQIITLVENQDFTVKYYNDFNEKVGDIYDDSGPSLQIYRNEMNINNDSYYSDSLHVDYHTQNPLSNSQQIQLNDENQITFTHGNSAGDVDTSWICDITFFGNASNLIARNIVSSSATRDIWNLYCQSGGRGSWGVSVNAYWPSSNVLRLYMVNIMDGYNTQYYWVNEYENATFGLLNTSLQIDFQYTI